MTGIDAELPFYDVHPMTDRVDRALMDRRTPMLLAVGFAAVASFLAAIGIYGVLAYQVTQRRREIGIRMALGAERNTIFSLVLREGAVMVGLGAALGLLGAFMLRQTLQSQLYGITATDPAVLAAVSAVLMFIAVVACLVPARKAARTDPVIALTDL